MATSQQGKKKKKVLSQQQIEKLLGMLKEEDKPLRAGILAKTLGYQSAKDINPTLLRLEGYGMVSRVTMNNTPLWKYCSREGVSTAAVMALPTGSSTGGATEGLRMMSGNQRQENGSMHSNSIDGRDDSRPSRPQSTKADLEWDPTDIQAHHDEDDPVHLENHTSVTSAQSSEINKPDFHQMMSYGNTTTANFINPPHDVSSMVGSNDNCLTVSSANFTETNLNPVSSLVFTTTPTYPSQGLYNAIDTRPDQVNMHMSMNGMDTKGNDGKDYMVHGDYTSMHAYGTGGGGNGSGVALNDMNGGHNLNITSGMQGNYSMDYTHHVNHDADMNHEGPSDMYMANNNVRHMTNGINPNSVQSGLHNFSLTHSQAPPDFPRNNNFNSSMPSAGLNHKSPGSSGQTYARGNHNHSHYSQNNYTPNNGNINRNSQVMPTYVVQEIIKAESVGQYGMAGPQGPHPPPPQETRTLSGYQSMHHHHQHGLDPGVMSYSQQQYHASAGNLNNGAPSTQHHHPHQQQQQQVQTQHHLHHHHHQQPPPLAQAANFVNMGTFPSGPYNQYQSTFGLGASNRTYSGQHQGPTTYSSGNINSKDFANYSGVNAGFRNPQGKRQHFNGFTSAGLYQNHIRTQVAFNKVNQGRQQSFSKQNYSRSNADRHRSHHHNRSKSGNGQGQSQRHTNHHHYDEGKMRQRCNSGDKCQAKSESNKFLGTEVLDDICRRLAKQANLNQQSSDVSSDQNLEVTDQPKESGDNSDRTKPVQLEDDSSTKDHLNNNDNIKVLEGVNTTKFGHPTEKQNSRDPNLGSRTQSHTRNYNGRYSHYPYRGSHYNRDNPRYNNNNYRVPSRNSDGKQRKVDNHGKTASVNNNQKPKVNAGAVTSNGKREDGREEKDVETKGSELNTHTIGNCESKEKTKDDRPLARYKAILADHLDPNNVLLSHLFVKGLIDQVLVDRVRRMKTRRDAMERLLPDLLNISEEAITDCFCDALQKSGQGHLSELLKGTGLSEGDMSEKHAAFLEHHRQNIAASMIPDKDLLAYLRTDSVLTSDLYRFVTSQPSRAQQIDTLLQILPFRGEKAFEVFRTALRRSGQPWLAEQIVMDLT